MFTARLFPLAKWANCIMTGIVTGNLVALHHYWLSGAQGGWQEPIFAPICLEKPNIQMVMPFVPGRILSLDSATDSVP